MFVRLPECQGLPTEIYVLRQSSLLRSDTFELLSKLKKTRSLLRSRYFLNNFNKFLASHADNSIRPSQVPIIGRLNSVSNIAPYFLKVHLNIIIQYKPHNSSRLLSSSFPSVALFCTWPSSDPPSSQGMSGDTDNREECQREVTEKSLLYCSRKKMMSRQSTHITFCTLP